MSERTRGLLRPRFTAEERQKLRDAQELTPQQIAWLQDSLADAMDRLVGATREDVHAELDALANHLDRAKALIDRWQGAGAPSAGDEALGHLSQAAVALSHSPLARTDGTWPSFTHVPVLVSLVATAARDAERKISPGTAKGQRRRVQRPASPAVIEKIVDALRRPDEASTRALANLKKTATNTSKKTDDEAPSLLGVANIVFAAVYRAWNQRNGRTDEDVPSAERSVRAYLKSLPEDKRPKPGRPKRTPVGE